MVLFNESLKIAMRIYDVNMFILIFIHMHMCTITKPNTISYKMHMPATSTMDLASIELFGGVILI